MGTCCASLLRGGVAWRCYRDREKRGQRRETDKERERMERGGERKGRARERNVGVGREGKRGR